LSVAPDHVTDVQPTQAELALVVPSWNPNPLPQLLLECKMHAVASTLDEYALEPQIVQNASALTVPAVKP